VTDLAVHVDDLSLGASWIDANPETVVAVVEDASPLAGIEGGASLRVERGRDG
jgi:hypothetical protein